MIFGVIVAGSNCLKGMQSGNSASAVGQATTAAVVTAITAVVTVDGAVEVRYDVERFEGVLAGPVSLEVSWQVVRRPSGEGIAGKRSVYAVPVQGKTEHIASYVEQLSAAIALWADEIAAAIPSP